MTSKTRYVMKLIFVIFLIIATPAVFFGSIGNHPLQVRENATRTIAVVNEDIETNQEGKSVKFGEKIMSILQEDSDYQWTVLGRSAAVNGLQNTKYDAVVYIPSDFSNNIMTYDSQQPMKAQFQYTVQDQLNVINREKVLREMERATNRVNGKITTLYWTYVSQDLENVRSRFDEILQKEIEFQNAMLAFYSPSSKNLTGNIEQQKGMIETIQTTMNSAAKASPQREDNMNQFQKDLTDFVEFVEKYKEYQEKQQQTLQQLQDNSLTEVANISMNQTSRYTNSIELFNQQSGQINVGLEEIGKQLEKSNQNISALSNVQLDKTEKMMTYFREQDENSFNEIESTLGSLKKELTRENQGQAYPAAVDMTRFSTEQTTTEKLNMEMERTELQAIAKEMNKVKESLATTAEPQAKQVVSAIDRLPVLAERISNVEQQLAAIENQENPLQKVVDELNVKINTLLENTSSLVGQNNGFIQEIEVKEEAILASPVLNQEKKDSLSATFSKNIDYWLPNTILNYYGSLVQLDTLLQNSLDDKKNYEATVKTITPILGATKGEQDILGELSTDLSASSIQMTDFQKQFQSFMTDYNQNIEDQQDSIMEDLGLIEESSNQVLEQLTLTDSPISTAGVDGNSVVVNQQGIAQEMTMINDLMNSLGKSQNQVVTYTNELQSKVQGVQKDANTLNNKWTTNVSTTKLFRDDMFNVLGNTYVDGRQNGPVYEHLANPLQISGDGTSKEEDKKVPPVIVLMIVLISGLLIGYFSHYFKGAPRLVQGSMFVLLNLIVGLIISLYGLNIYPLEEVRAIEWTITTILLLTAASTVVLVSFTFGNLLGWIVSVGLVMFFIGSFLPLLAPNINYEDPMSKVYMSIQYEDQTLFIPTVSILAAIILALTLLPLGMSIWKNRVSDINEDQANEA